MSRVTAAEGAPLSPKAIDALRHLQGTSIRDTRSAKALARLMWPERLQACGTSLRRGGLYRAAGAYYSKLQKLGLVGHWMTDFDKGYFLTDKGAQALAEATSEPAQSRSLD